MTFRKAAVIGAVLRATTLAPGQRRLVLANRTVAPPLDEARAAELAAWEQPELVTAFRDRAAQVLPLPSKLNLPVTLSLADGASLRAHDAAPNWATFQRAFPRANGYAEVSGVDHTGEPVHYEGRGFLARCLQHETDHTNGIVFGDRISNRARKKLYKEADKAAEDFPPGWPA